MFERVDIQRENSTQAIQTRNTTNEGATNDPNGRCANGRSEGEFLLHVDHNTQGSSCPQGQICGAGQDEPRTPSEVRGRSKGAGLETLGNVGGSDTGVTAVDGPVLLYPIQRNKVGKVWKDSPRVIPRWPAIDAGQPPCFDESW